MAKAGALLVFGSHRSGTSFVAGLAELAGFARLASPDVADTSTNPHGHREVRVLADLNERLLQEMGGAWSAPATYSSPLPLDSLDNLWVERARTALARLEVEETWYWKDPRLSMLTEFWVAHVIRRPVGGALVWRHPIEVARSLERRNRLPIPYGLALWECYVRHALLQLPGHPIAVVDYDSALASPDGLVETLRQLATKTGLSLGPGVSSVDVDRWTDPSARHHHFDSDAATMLSPPQRELVDLLTQLPAVSTSFPRLELPPPTPWAKALVGQRRRAEGFRRQILARKRRRPRAVLRRLGRQIERRSRRPWRAGV